LSRSVEQGVAKSLSSLDTKRPKGIAVSLPLRIVELAQQRFEIRFFLCPPLILTRWAHVDPCTAALARAHNPTQVKGLLLRLRVGTRHPLTS
jgi:hypothetical protein